MILRHMTSLLMMCMTKLKKYTYLSTATLLFKLRQCSITTPCRIFFYIKSTSTKQSFLKKQCQNLITSLWTSSATTLSKTRITGTKMDLWRLLQSLSMRHQLVQIQETLLLASIQTKSVQLMPLSKFATRWAGLRRTALVLLLVETLLGKVLSLLRIQILAMLLYKWTMEPLLKFLATLLRKSALLNQYQLLTFHRTILIFQAF